MRKYSKYLVFKDKETNFFDHLFETSKTLFIQMRGERELVIFLKDVFLGKYKNLMGESMEYMMNKARALGEDILDEPFEIYAKELKAMIELMKNGMMKD